MTIETTTEPNFREIATNLVNGSAQHVIIDEFVKLMEESNYHKSNYMIEQNRHSNTRTAFNKFKNTVEEFIKEHVIDNEDADVEELTELASDLGIELTKRVRVTFNVEVEYEIEVGLDDEIDENDFDVRIEYNGEGDVQSQTESIVEFDSEDMD